MTATSRRLLRAALVVAALQAAPIVGQPAETSGRVLDDPVATFAAEVEAVLAGRPRVAALRELFEQWAAIDPVAAAQAVESLARSNDSGLMREALGEITGRRWVQRDPDSAIDWALRLGELSVWSGVVVGLAGTDPERAMTVASSVQTRPGEEMVNVVIAEIATRDPVAAAEYWQQAGLAELGVYTANRIARNWVARDPAAAEHWVLGLPGGAGRDTALATIVAVHTYDSARAAVLVNQIGDDRTRGMAAHGWLQNALSRGDPHVLDFESRLVLSPAARSELDALVRR